MSAAWVSSCTLTEVRVSGTRPNHCTGHTSSYAQDSAACRILRQATLLLALSGVRALAHLPRHGRVQAERQAGERERAHLQRQNPLLEARDLPALRMQAVARWSAAAAVQLGPSFFNCKASISIPWSSSGCSKPLACRWRAASITAHRPCTKHILLYCSLNGGCTPASLRADGSSRKATHKISCRERGLALRSAMRHGCLQGMLCPGDGFERLLRPGGFKRTSGRSASHPVHRCVTEHHFPLSWPSMAGRLRHATRRVLSARAHHRRVPATLAHAGPGQQLSAVQRVSVCSATWLFPHAEPSKLAVFLRG